MFQAFAKKSVNAWLERAIDLVRQHRIITTPHASRPWGVKRRISASY